MASIQSKLSPDELPFEVRALSALGISITADALDYIGAPIFAMPIIGDIADSIVTGLLYSITKSKTSTLINTIEFIPFIGDFVPTYTLSTLMWINREWKKNKGGGNTESLRTKLLRKYAVLKSRSLI